MEMGRVDSNPGNHVSLNIPVQPRSVLKDSGYSPVNTGILVQNARKAYGNHPPILNNYNMCVPKGTIYGLLGSSGCGKTTILSCIVGLRKLDSGQITVFGGKPGTLESGIPGPRVGYMPQDIALYSAFSISQCLQYYGRIYGLSLSEIEKRMEYLMGFLDLPDGSRIISTLSGGQQRRTSLAVSLVHSPELLILDEPTVGVDPLVREKIWEHIVNLAKTKKTTVIVTTHYIEEARQAHTVGLMRNGKLLCEKSPNTLLLEHNADLLEDIVLKLCKKDNLGLIEGNPTDEVSQALQEISFYSGKGDKKEPYIAGDKSPIVGLKFKRRFTEENMMQRRASLKRQQSVAVMAQEANEYFHSRKDRIRALIIRNYITFFRNLIFVIGVLFLPALQIVVCNLIIGYDPKNLNFGLVNHEVPFANDTICPYKEGCLAEGLSCKYVASLKGDEVNMKRFESEEDALHEIENGRIWGYMSFPENFTGHMGDRALSKQFATNETINGTTISIRMDMSHYLGGALLTKLFYENYQTFIKQVAGECDDQSMAGDIPINYRTPVYGSLGTDDQKATGYQEFISPATLILVLFFVPLASGGIAYIKDKKEGTLDRSMVAGVTAFDVLIAFMFTEGSLIVVQALVSFIILVFAFGLIIQGSSMLFLIICLLTGITGLSLGFLIAMLVDEELEAVIIALGLYAPIMILSGIIWPLNGVNSILLFISTCLPCTLATESIRSITSRGWGISHPHVYEGILVLLAWSVGCWILTALTHRARNK